MNSAIFLIGSAQAFFLVVLLMTKKRRQQADYLLALWLFLLGMHLAVFYKQELSGVSDWLWRANAGISFIQGPFLFLYSKSLIKGGINKTELIHFLAPAIYLGSFKFFENFWNAYILLLVILSFGIYIGLNLKLLQRHRSSIKERFSNIDKISLRWLFMLTISLSILLIVVVFDQLVINVHSGNEHSPIFVAVGLLVIIIGYFGLSQGPILVSQQKNGEKYAGSALDDQSKAKIMNSLDALMNIENLYLQEDLNLTALSQKLEVSENDLSQSFGHNNTNFYDYVNGKRVEHAMLLIEGGKHGHLSLLGIAFESGFQSKATFNRAFKKHTQLTPSAFKKKVQNK